MAMTIMAVVWLCTITGLLFWMAKIDNLNRRLKIENKAVWHCALGYHPLVEQMQQGHHDRMSEMLKMHASVVADNEALKLQVLVLAKGDAQHE